MKYYVVTTSAVGHGWGKPIFVATEPKDIEAFVIKRFKKAFFPAVFNEDSIKVDQKKNESYYHIRVSGEHSTGGCCSEYDVFEIEEKPENLF